MKAWLSRVFLALGILTSLVIGFGTYLWFADPFAMRDEYEVLVGNVVAVTKATTAHLQGTATEDVAPALKQGTGSVLDMVGIGSE